MQSPTNHTPARSSFTLNHHSPVQENMSPTTPTYHHDHSYLSHRSAPSTPGLLSHHHPNHHYSKPLPSALRTSKSKSNLPSDTLPRARSTTQLQSQRDAAAHHRRRQTSALRLTTSQPMDPDWVFRAGATIASEVGESKGQSWLSQRASSTSLVRMGDEDSDSDSDTGRGGIKSAGTDEVVTPWEARRRALEADARSRTQSRAASRVASRAQSTRGSRSSSRAALDRPPAGLAMTPGRTAVNAVDDYFGAGAVDEDDVDVEEEVDELYRTQDQGREGDEDEREVAKLTGVKTLGLGSWVDGLMNWILYDDVEEERVRLEKSQRMVRDSYRSKSAQMSGISEGSASEGSEVSGPGGEGGVVKDAMWLFGTASKLIF